jgi:hypothetical protein
MTSAGAREREKALATGGTGAIGPTDPSRKEKASVHSFRVFLLVS